MGNMFLYMHRKFDGKWMVFTALGNSRDEASNIKLIQKWNEKYNAEGDEYRYLPMSCARNIFSKKELDDLLYDKCGGLNWNRE